MGQFVWLVVRTLLVTILAQGVLLWLDSNFSVRPQQWVALMLGKSTDPSTLHALSLMLAGAVAFVIVIAWEVLQVSSLISARVSARWPKITKLPDGPVRSRKVLLGWALIIVCGLGFLTGIALVVLENRSPVQRAEAPPAPAPQPLPINSASAAPPKAASGPPSVTKEPNKPFLDSDAIKRRQAVLEEYRANINGPILLAFRQSRQLWDDWNVAEPKLGVQELHSRLDAILKSTTAAFELNDELWRKYHFDYPEITDLTDWTFDKIREKTALFRGQLPRLFRLNDADAKLALQGNRFVDEYYDGVNAFDQWIIAKRKVIADKTKEYEAASAQLSKRSSGASAPEQNKEVAKPLIARARFLYDQRSETMAVIGKQDLEIVTVEKDSNYLLSSSATTNVFGFGHFTARFAFPRETGPFDVRISGGPIGPMAMMAGSVIDNEKGYVKVRFFPTLNTSIAMTGDQPKSAEITVSFYRQ